MTNKKDKNKENSLKSEVARQEEKILEFWDKAEIFKQSVEKKAPNGDYVFYDGPPFATGLPHYGHIVASIIKDVVPRYWTMKGYRVERKWGWDCHGLPIENIVEKELGINSKKDIEKIGVAKFNKICRSKVMEFADDWKKYVRKLGRWVDMENGYKTMDKDFMESVWWVFKNLYDKGLIYKGYRSMHICPRCETTLSQSEVTEGYKDIKDLSVIAKFELVDEPGTYVLAWTTTPWTLIGNVALAVGESIDYVKVKILDVAKRAKEGKIKYQKVIIAKDIFEQLQDKPDTNLLKLAFNLVVLHEKKEGEEYIEEYDIIKEFKGSELVGKKYKPLFDYYASDKDLKNTKNGWNIYTGDFVSTEEGTGIVHIAPAFGDDDMKMGKKHKLPFVQHVRMDGSIKDRVKDFKGMNVKAIKDHMKTDIKIIKYLARNNLLFLKEKYEHSYPHCWRCNTPLLNYATSSWFVNVLKMKKRMLELAKGINWSPKHIKKGRWGKWLEGARDWSISRQRFWASVMPIWECECGEMKVIGSVEELEKLSKKKIIDLHKDTVDKIKFPCEKCDKKMRRIPDVLDCWFESGSMPYAQMHYPFENKNKFENNFPAQFIAEGADQTRCWFYYLHVLATGVRDVRAFQNVIVNGIVLAEDGKKMSKKLQNYPDPMDIFDKYGSDALRYYLLTSPVMLADNLNFSEKGVEESLRKVNMILLNVARFYSMFVGDLKIKDEKIKIESEHILDKWILARLNQLINEATDKMDNYDLPRASRPIIEFIDDLSTWYIRRSRDRFKGEDENDKKAAINTTGFVLMQLSKVMAPFMPFIAEKLWQEVGGKNFKDKNKSVHLEKWPKAKKLSMEEKDILRHMDICRKIVELGLAKRDEAGIKVRQPLSKLRITNYELRNEYMDLVKDELNVKIVETQSLASSSGENNIKVDLDTKLTFELKQEGIAREIIRHVNSMRKKQGFTIKDRINIYLYVESDNIKKVIDNNEYYNYILNGALAYNIAGQGIKPIESDNPKFFKEVKINKELVNIGIQKI
ncbi:isoleucine--tRNA ligase [Candidatus Parcubacteria bacterium]|nr:isoleucine--tRNA ligase [Candidatus Parcubacteria bacterium]